MTRIRVWLAFALITAALGLRSANAQDFLNQDWVLNAPLSHVYLTTEKLEAVIEKHQFMSVEGAVNKDGDATVKLDLGSLETHIDIRNVRMRFLLFETFKFPNAIITTRLDKARLRELATKSTINYPLILTVNMHGVSNQIQTVVSISRTSDTTVTVATTAPIVVTADSFGFVPGLAKLSDAAGGIRIVPQASITFDLVFGTGAQTPELEAARASREKAKAEQETKNITAEGCETRLTVISENNAIYFKTGSAELDKGSEPMLDTGADIAKRCPSVKFEVDGHTDSIGPKGYNQTLSEQRAKSVVDYLAAKGVAAARIHAVGYGDTRPVVPNDSEANRAKNRRIEFKVTRD
jgi:OmpA-OmpF porin, OOP family